MPPKIKRTYSRCKKTTNEQFVQTEDDALLKLSNQLLNDLQKHVTDPKEQTPEESIRRQIILSSHVKKLSKENFELKDRLGKMNLKFSSILDKLRIYKDSADIRFTIPENRKFGFLLVSIYYAHFETEQQKSLDKIKVKEAKLTKLKTEKDEINFQLQNVLNAFQVQSRLLEVARKEAFNAREESKETEQKLQDKLYLTTNQRCANCEVKQKVQNNLTDQIADLKNKIAMKEQELEERARINVIFAEKVKKDKEEFNKKELLAKKELEKANNLKRAYCDKLREYQKALENERNGRASSISCQSLPESSALTPPEEVDRSPSVNINNNSEINKSATTNNSPTKQTQKDNSAVPPPEKIRKTTFEVARGWKAVLDLADSLDGSNRQMNQPQPKMPGTTTTIPRMPAKPISSLALKQKTKAKKQQQKQINLHQLQQSNQQNMRLFNGNNSLQRNPSDIQSSSNTWRSSGIRVHENFHSHNQSNKEMINRSLQNESMLRQKAVQQTRQQPVPINRLTMNQQPGTSNRQQDNFTVNRDLLPWHGTIIKQQQPTPDSTPSLYRSFW
ncbi:unnamed protein product [Meloidogyne enterolobii]|uniref:Uncharacterized protein n=1 Tax=Meloidogyne enterolobii TaxID=390850 RepID=A0ACB0XNQ5_MELEN